MTFTLDELTDTDLAGQEYKYHILLYPNITYQQDLERDSNTIVTRNVLDYLERHHPDVFVTVVYPELLGFKNKNIRQVQLPVPSYPNAMRTHFDYPAFMRAIEPDKYAYDFVYSFLPEHTLQIVNALYNTSNLSPRVIGYCHWFEVPENTAYAKTMLPANLFGLLQMEECGLNSEWLKSLILDRYASKLLAPAQVEKLRTILQPHYLGIDGSEVREKTMASPADPMKIVFNHRPNEYTGWAWFAETMDRLWEEDHGFQVYTTMADAKRPWNVVKNTLTQRKEYLHFLHSMDVGVGCFEKYSAWSISTTDGLSQGTPYLLPESLCYPELVGPSYPLLYSNREEFVRLLKRCRDDRGQLIKARQYLSTNIIPSLEWDSAISHWFRGWRIFDGFHTLSEPTAAYKKMLRFIEREGSTTKAEIIKYMNWSERIGFSTYRNTLRTEPHIRLTSSRYEVRQ